MTTAALPARGGGRVQTVLRSHSHFNREGLSMLLAVAPKEDGRRKGVSHGLSSSSLHLSLSSMRSGEQERMQERN